MAELQEYKCPCCGGAIAFDSTLQKMKCPYCDTEYEMETLAAYDTELNDETADSINWNKPDSQWENGETDGLLTYVCKSCGGEIVGDASTAAMSCPYCDNPVVMMGQLSGALKPDLVIPFKLDKKAAKAALQKHYGGKKLLPKVFGDQKMVRTTAIARSFSEEVKEYVRARTRIEGKPIRLLRYGLNAEGRLFLTEEDAGENTGENV